MPLGLLKKWDIKYLIILFLLLPTLSFGYSFTFTVTPTAESCSGNGTLTFNTTNADPNGSIVYLVYKLPDTSTPFAVIDKTFLDGLSSGNYRIIAFETIGSISSPPQQVDVTIESTVVPLEFAVLSLNQGCNISVMLTSGVATGYEIFSGPKKFPLQTTNSFQNLPLGVYKIRVFDNCGVGIVQTFTVEMNTNALTIENTEYKNLSSPTCDYTIATSIIESATGTVIGYPLNIQYTIYPPDGSPNIIINNSLKNGDLLSQEIFETIPLYVNQKYSYEIEITDICGITYYEKFTVDYDISIEEKDLKSECDQYFKLVTKNFIPPYTLNFTSFPVNFDPSTLNQDYPGPFNDSEVIIGGDGNPVPFGNYDVTITDACGRTADTSFTIKYNPPKPNAIVTNNGCLINTGKIIIKLLPSYQIATAKISKAPAEFNFPLPYDVSSKIDKNGILTINSVPLGEYEFLITDTCNNKMISVQVSIPIFENLGLETETREGCELQTGSIKISSKNKNRLKSVIITSAPTDFSENIPFDVSNNITTVNGKFYFDNLPKGNYTFETIDDCNFSNTITIPIAGYTITNSTFSLNKNCGSFDIPLYLNSNVHYKKDSEENETFWLQKLLNNGKWGHPESGIEYTEGTLPDELTNSYPLNNQTKNLNLTFNGTFRIIRAFYTYNNGIDLNTETAINENKICYEVITSDLKFNEALEITEANKIPCTANGKLDVILKAKGPLPLHYSIVSKDGMPFSLDNGNSNIFNNLTPAIYTFKVQDNCGGIKNRIFNVSALVSLVVNYKACDILKCVNVNTGLETVDLSLQNKSIYGNQSTEDYTLNYFESLSDAQTFSNPILDLENYKPKSSTQTIFTRLYFNQLPNCFETNSFNVIIGQIPKLSLKAETLSCSQLPVLLNASINNLPTTTYFWSNGVSNPANIVRDLGITNLTVDATNSYGVCNDIPLNCMNSKDITVNIPRIPVIDKIETQDWTLDENSIQIITSKSDLFEYSMDNITFQDHNTFTNLKAGLYTVYVRNKDGCETISKEIWLLNYPKFFTPNNDGFNDTWFIKNSILEPDFKVYIHDRFGKLITSFNSNSDGWDGNYNGNQMKSSDYWFVVYRQDGKSHTGHFSLVR